MWQKVEKEKRIADHLLYVSLKYTKTGDVILNLIERWRGVDKKKMKKKKNQVEKKKKKKDKNTILNTPGRKDKFLMQELGKEGNIKVPLGNGIHIFFYHH